MPNPALLLCDSDALIQLFSVDDLRPLQELVRQFGIQPAITLEVDLELRWLGKHKDRFVVPLDKALKHGTLIKLDQSRFQTYLGTAAPGTSWNTYQALGAQYYGFVQRGEAYTHAAAVTLGMPALTNDQKAVIVLQGQMLRVAVPVLRSFDIFTFAYESGILDIKDCESIRSELLRIGEGMPGPFLHASFEDGAKKFPCRLRQASASVTPRAPPTNHYDPITIVRL
jgi:hypothetical protein